MRHVEIKHSQIPGHGPEHKGSSVTFEFGPGEYAHHADPSGGLHTVMIVCGHCQRKTFYHETTGIFQCGSCKRIYNVHGEPA
jgi:hypothetical protein